MSNQARGNQAFPHCIHCTGTMFQGRTCLRGGHDYGTCPGCPLCAAWLCFHICKQRDGNVVPHDDDQAQVQQLVHSSP